MIIFSGLKKKLMGKKARAKPKRLAEKLWQIRQRLKLTQTEFAQLLGLKKVSTQKYISHFETGQREPDLLQLLKYARLGQTSVEVLLDDQQELSFSGLSSPHEKKKPPWLYQFCVSLDEVRPVVWRRLQVHSATSVLQLNKIILIAMGWPLKPQNWKFKFSTFVRARLTPVMLIPNFFIQEQMFWHELESPDSWNYWRHKIKVISIREATPQDTPSPLCLAGANKCPPPHFHGAEDYEKFCRSLQRSPLSDSQKIYEPGWHITDIDLALINHDLQGLYACCGHKDHTYL